MRVQAITGAAGTLEVIVQLTTADTGVTAKLGRVADNNTVTNNVFGNDRSGAYNRVLADCNPAKDRGIAADRNTFFNQSFLKRPLIMPVAARVTIIDKSHIRAAKNIVFKCHPFKNTDVMLDSHIIADNRAFFYKRAIADIAVSPDYGPALNVGKRPNTRVVAYFSVGADQGMFVFKVTHLLNGYEGTFIVHGFLDGTESFDDLETFLRIDQNRLFITLDALDKMKVLQFKRLLNPDLGDHD